MRCMAHTYTNLLAHIIFSTKDRALADADLKARLFPYMGGIIRELGSTASSSMAQRTTFTSSTALPEARRVGACGKLANSLGASRVSVASFAWQTGRRVQRQPVAYNRSTHREPGGTSPQRDVSGGAACVLSAARNPPRPSLRVRLMRPSPTRFCRLTGLSRVVAASHGSRRGLLFYASQLAIDTGRVSALFGHPFWSPHG